MGVAAVGGQVVQVEQALADALLQVQGVLHDLESALLGLGHPDVEEGEPAAMPVQPEHQALGPLAVLVGEEQEEVGDELQGHVVVVVKGAGPGQALEGLVDLQSGGAVERDLALAVVMAAHLHGLCGHHGGRCHHHPAGLSDRKTADQAAGGWAAAEAEIPSASSEPSNGKP